MILGGWQGAGRALHPTSCCQPPPRSHHRSHRRPTATCAKNVLSQAPVLCTLAGTLAAGLVLDVEACRAVGATFCFLFVGTRLGELRLHE